MKKIFLLLIFEVIFASSLYAQNATILKDIKIKKAPQAFENYPTVHQKWHIEKDSLLRKNIVIEIERLKKVDPQEVYAFPAANDFPGAVDSDARLITKTIKIPHAMRGQWISTGLYAIAGVPLEIAVEDNFPLLKDELVIGCHTDRLSDRHDKWSRLPSISYRYALNKKNLSVCSPMGGLVYVDAKNRDSIFDMTLHIKNGIEAPLFILGKTTQKEWQKILENTKSPWGEIICNRLIFSFPTSDLKKILNPQPLCEHVDSGMHLQDLLAGWRKYPWKTKNPMRLVVDRQISAGAGHSGYPAMGHLNWSKSMVSGNILKEGDWGLWHEVGHNHQQPPWRLDGMGEVTVNLFTLICQMENSKTPLRGSVKQYEDNPQLVVNFLSEGKGIYDGDVWMRLYFFIPIIREFGFEPFIKTAEAFMDNPYEKNATNEVRFSYLMKMLSLKSRRNLASYFTRWKIKLLNSDVKAVSHLPLFQWDLEEKISEKMKKISPVVDKKK